MTEPLKPSDIEPAPGVAPSSVQPDVRREVGNALNTGYFPKIFAGAFVLLLLLLAAHWWSSRIEINGLREELARRLQVGDTTNIETKNLANTTHESVKELQAKVAALESKQMETVAQQLALTQLYQELSKNRDEWVLSEIEQVLSTANQQLQLSGNIQGAMIALQNAERSLSRLDKPQFIPIRRAITRDIDRLKALPIVDLTGMALRIDSLIGQVDRLPLYADEKPAIPAMQPKTQTRVVPKAENVTRAAGVRAWFSEGWSAIQEAWRSWSSEMWGEIRQLVRIRSVEEPNALLISPDQAYFIRENLKLRLLNARLALLSRNEATFRSDMVVAQDALNKYFDPLAKQTQSAQAIIKQVQGSDLSIEIPPLESLAAISNFRTKN